MPHQKKHPMRKCVGCRQMFQKSQLIRIVKNLDGGIMPDLKGKSPGRGAYICNNTQCLKQAEKSKAFQRVFKCAASSDLFDQLYSIINGGMLNE